ncbi:MAG: hypothetical protein ABJN72_02880 [Sulfitobacter sp.]
MAKPRLIASAAEIAVLAIIGAALSGCAAVAVATVIGAAPAIADKVPRARGIDGYTETINGTPVRVDNTVLRTCHAKPSLAERRPGRLLCARISLPPQSGFSPQQKVAFVKQVIAKNKHMAPTGVSKRELINANAALLNKPSYPHVYESINFSYYALTDERTVFEAKNS